MEGLFRGKKRKRGEKELTDVHISGGSAKGLLGGEKGKA